MLLIVGIFLFRERSSAFASLRPCLVSRGSDRLGNPPMQQCFVEDAIERRVMRVIGTCALA